MISYTVFPFKASGVAPIFVPIQSKNDTTATATAIKLLQEHSCADRVMVWCEDRLVYSGLSRHCADWIAATPERRVSCPALNSAEKPCPHDCGVIRPKVR